MKRAIVLICAGLLAVSFAACGNKENSVGDRAEEHVVTEEIAGVIEEPDADGNFPEDMTDQEERPEHEVAEKPEDKATEDKAAEDPEKKAEEKPEKKSAEEPEDNKKPLPGIKTDRKFVCRTTGNSLTAPGSIPDVRSCIRPMKTEKILLLGSTPVTGQPVAQRSIHTVIRIAVRR